MTGRLLVVALGVASLAGNARAAAQSFALLDAPGAYSLAPAATPGFGSELARSSGEASLAYGSHHARAAAISMQTGLLGDTGARGFVSLGTGEADLGRTRARIQTRAGEIGITKRFADGTTISVSGGWMRAGLTGAGRYAAGLP